MDLLWFFSVLCLLCLCARLFICALWSPAGKGLTSWLSFVVSVNLPLSHWYPGSGQYLIVSIPDLCNPYLLFKDIFLFSLWHPFYIELIKKRNFGFKIKLIKTFADIFYKNFVKIKFSYGSVIINVVNY